MAPASCSMWAVYLASWCCPVPVGRLEVAEAVFVFAAAVQRRITA
jgi:hypothetical protein